MVRQEKKNSGSNAGNVTGAGIENAELGSEPDLSVVRPKPLPFTPVETGAKNEEKAEVYSYPTTAKESESMSKQQSQATTSKPRVAKKSKKAAPKQKSATPKVITSILTEERKKIEKAVQQSKDKPEGAKKKNRELLTGLPISEKNLDGIWSSLQDVVEESWECCSQSSDSIQDCMNESIKVAESWFESYIKNIETMMATSSPFEAFDLQEKFIRNQSDMLLDCVSHVLKKMDGCCKNLNSCQDNIIKTSNDLVRNLQQDYE